MTYDPNSDALWSQARKYSPHRAPYSDHELAELRIQADPRRAEHPMPSNLAVVIWTLLDMLEEQRGWTTGEDAPPSLPQREPQARLVFVEGNTRTTAWIGPWEYAGRPGAVFQVPGGMLGRKGTFVLEDAP